MWLCVFITFLLSAAQPRDLEKRVFSEINEKRHAQHLPALAWSDKVAAAARRHSSNMEHDGFFSHIDPEHGGPAQRLTHAGIDWSACAENIFQETGMGDPVKAAVATWMQSPGHRRNILDRQYTQSGVGISVSRDGTYTMTQMFVTPPSGTRRR